MGESLTKLNLRQGHSRLTAFAAMRKKDKTLAERAWAEFYEGGAGIKNHSLKTVQLKGPDVLAPVEEAPGVSTNAVAQWGLAAMQCLAFTKMDRAVEYKSGGEKKVLIYQDDFTQPLDTTIWKAEIAKLPGSSVMAENGKLILDTQGGVTVWFNKILKGNIEIQYNRVVVVDGRANDRLSDLNQFWMANDPRDKNLFTRDGVLEKYDSLVLYYAGIVGNSNTTTRFRKYPGDGQRVLIEEFTGSSAEFLRSYWTRSRSVIILDNHHAIASDIWWRR